MVQIPGQRRPRFLVGGLTVLLLVLAATGCMKRYADLEVSTSELDFGNQLSRSSFHVKNDGKDVWITAGVTPLEYDISADKRWLTLNPMSGTCGGGQQNTHVVEIDRSLLTVGSNTATISITSNGGAWSITVRADHGPPACVAPPAAPLNSAPSNGSVATPIGADLVWTDGASQCPGLTATYDVHFGTSPSPPFEHNNGNSKSWDPGTLASGTTYYWRIVAKDANGSTPGPVWSFTTEVPCVALPSAACTPSPSDGADNVNENANLAWGCGVSQCSGLAATYDVYFGTSPAPGPQEFKGNTASRAWELPRQAKDTTFYWQIVTKDANGSRPGPVWEFKTRR